ncbi:MAG: YfhO family protein [Acidobacteria bacterium]|nr:YfhO family protein [Acidobacteriota bacterium]
MASTSATDSQAPDANDRRWWPRLAIAVVLLALPLVFFYPATLGQVTLAPGDGWTQIFGIRVLIGQMLRNGEWPLWNPYIFAGMPLLASIQPGALYPPTWLFAILSSKVAMNVMVLTTYHIALAGAYLYARRIGIVRLGALIAAITFSFGGFMLTHLGHTNRIAAGAWLPWILLAVEELYQHARWRWIALGSLFIALQLLAGEPQMNCYTIIVVGAYGLFSLLFRPARETRLHFLLGSLAMAICGLLISMIQLLPERELLNQGERASINYDYFAQFSFPPRQVFALLAPYFFGGAALDPYRVPYWGQWNISETCGYTGMLALLLALVAIVAQRRDRLTIFWVFIALLALTLSFGGYLPFGIHRMLHHVPVYNLFRAPGRHMLEFTLAIGILAGRGLTALYTAERKTALRAVLFSSALIALAMTATAIVYVYYDKALVTEIPLPEVASSLKNPDIYIPIICCAVSLILLWLTFALGKRAVWMPALLVLALFLDLASFGFFFEWRLTKYNIPEKLADSPIVKFIKEREPDWHAFRMISHSPYPFSYNTDLINYPNTSIVRGLESVNGYDPVRIQRVSELSGSLSIDGYVSDLEAFGTQHQGLNLLNTKYLVYDGGDYSFIPENNVEFDGVRFSVPIDLRLKPGVHTQVSTKAFANELVLISAMGSSESLTTGQPVVHLKLHTTDGRVIEHDLLAGRDSSEWAYDREDVRARIKHERARVIETWPVGDFQGHRYIARFKFERAEIASVEFSYLPNVADLTVARASLYDEETKKSEPLDAINLPLERWRKVMNVGPIILYENLQTRPRAWFAPKAVVMTSPEVAQTIKTGKMPDGTPFNPAETVLLEREIFGTRLLHPNLGISPDAQVKVTNYSPHRIEVQTHNGMPSWLVLSEIYYRGWEAWLDGQRVPVERVNYTLRGVEIPAGDHRLEFVFRAHSFRNGAAYSLLGVLLLLVGSRLRRPNLDGGEKHTEKILKRLRRPTRSQLLGGGLIFLLVVFTWVLIKHASYAVGGSDSAGYAAVARALQQGKVALPIPELEQFGLPEQYAPIFTPLAYRPAQVNGIYNKLTVSIYPIGFPLHLLLGALLVGWQVGPYLVSPLIAAFSLLLFYFVGLRFGLTPVAAVAGTVVLAACPTFIFFSLQPMSDLTAMFWGLLLIWAALRAHENPRWALLAGAAFGVAFLVRPTNVLLLLPLLFCLPLKPKTLLLFGLGGFPLAVIFCLYNYAAFGHPLQTGYGSINLYQLISLRGSTIRFNHYVYWIAMTLSPLLLLGWLGVGALRQISWQRRALLLVWFGAFLLFYACYEIFDEWWYTRFLLPGYPGLILGAVLTAQTLLQQIFRANRIARVAVGLVLLGISFGFAYRHNHKYEVFRIGRGEAVHIKSCRWADAQLPSQAVLVAAEMSGAINFYTRRPFLRWDFVAPESWPMLKKHVQERGYQFYALLMPHEVELAQQHVPGRWKEVGMERHISLWQIEPLDRPLPQYKFGEGFSGLERDGNDKSWRWMSSEAVVQLQNTGRDMYLRIEGEVPFPSVTRPVTFKLLLNGNLVGQVVTEEHAFRQEFAISPAQQGSAAWSELRLVVDKFFVPHEVNPNSKDYRRLSFSFTNLVWEEQELRNKSAPPQ